MNKLYKKANSTDFTEKQELDPIKMARVKTLLLRQKSNPTYHLWDKQDEFEIIQALALGSVPLQYGDTQLLARELYTSYIAWKFKGLDGIGEWTKKFADHFKEEADL